MKVPTNQLEFEKMFKTKQSCIEYLELDE